MINKELKNQGGIKQTNATTLPQILEKGKKKERKKIEKKGNKHKIVVSLLTLFHSVLGGIGNTHSTKGKNKNRRGSTLT